MPVAPDRSRRSEECQKRTHSITSCERANGIRPHGGALAQTRLLSEVPAPVLGHPSVGGAVARYVADAGERKVIPQQHDTVGRRLIK
jgi:hypothetical protein